MNKQELIRGDGKYIGQVVNGKREGFGIMLFNNGEHYEGLWKNDKEEGTGCFISMNKYKYQGYWKNGFMD